MRKPLTTESTKTSKIFRPIPAVRPTAKRTMMIRTCAQKQRLRRRSQWLCLRCRRQRCPHPALLHPLLHPRWRLRSRRDFITISELLSHNFARYRNLTAVVARAPSPHCARGSRHREQSSVVGNVFSHVGSRGHHQDLFRKVSSLGFASRLPCEQRRVQSRKYSTFFWRPGQTTVFVHCLKALVARVALATVQADV